MGSASQGTLQRKNLWGVKRIERKNKEGFSDKIMAKLDLRIWQKMVSMMSDLGLRGHFGGGIL
jgi:hypothetical protein